MTGKIYTEDDVRKIIVLAFEETGEGVNGEYCRCRNRPKPATEHQEHMEMFCDDVLAEFTKDQP